MFKISTDLFQVRHGSLSLQTNTRKINKQEKVNKQCQTSFLSRKEEQKKSQKIIPEKLQRKFLKFEESQEKSRKIQKNFRENSWNSRKIPWNSKENSWKIKIPGKNLPDKVSCAGRWRTLFQIFLSVLKSSEMISSVFVSSSSILTLRTLWTSSNNCVKLKQE